MTGASNSKRGGFGKLLLVFALGVLALGSARFVFAGPPPATHYHANFMIYVDGQPLDLSGDRYMEEVASCYAESGGNIAPVHRAHMHEGMGNVVHVHHPGVTWGHFFANIGFAVGTDYLFTDSDRLMNEGERSLKLVVNGFAVESIENRPILSEDRLVVSFGSESFDDVMSTHFGAVPTTAAEFNETQDPASCAGHGELTFMERLRWAFWTA